MSLVIRLVIFICLLLIAAVAGLYLGRVSVRDEPLGTTRVAHMPASPVRPTDATVTADDSDGVTPPVYFYAGHTEDDNWKLIGEQVQLAAAAQVHQYIVPISIAWTSEAYPEAAAQYLDILERYIAWDNHAKLLLQVNLNPPISWFEAHPAAAIRVNDTLQPYPTPTSAVWQETARAGLEHLIRTVESSIHRERLLGYVLGALLEQRWTLPESYDRSDANRHGFSRWLRRRYADEHALQTAWARSDIGFDTVSIPPRPDTSDLTGIFVSLPEQQPVADYLRYTSESVADALAGFASMTAATSAITPAIGAFYGFSFEMPSNSAGHFALTLLLESDLNTIISPVSYVDRGLGGAGGMMGPIDSWTIRGKRWLLFDDTRTGVERDNETGEFSRIKGIRAEDVYEVQRRNFSMALTFGLGLVWADPQAEGWLYDAEQWAYLGKLRDIYADIIADDVSSPDVSGDDAVMTVVIDEEARFFQQCDTLLNLSLLVKGRDAVLRSGINSRFHLLRDVIEWRAPPTPIYLFLNAFHLSEEDRERLHARLAHEQASAVWVYAPGYISHAPDVENIGATTGMDIRAFDGPARTGSVYLLSGQHMRSEQRFGSGESWAPLFYIAPDENTDFLARYEDEEDKGSVAILTMPEEWTSVYIAEPEPSAALLCEIVRLLEQHVYLSPVETAYYDAFFARDNLLALHASQAGKREIQFGYFCDSEDLIDPSIGWLQKDSVMLSVRTGETRLLRHRPIQAGAQ